MADARLDDGRPLRRTAGRHDVLQLFGDRHQRRGDRHCGPVHRDGVAGHHVPRRGHFGVALSPTTVPLRTVASCTLTIANAGPAVARFVAAGISLPHRFWRVSATPGARWFGTTGVWFLRTLPAGSSASYSVTFRDGRPGQGWVWAVGVSRSPDLDHSNNVATATVTVTG